MPAMELFIFSLWFALLLAFLPLYLRYRRIRANMSDAERRAADQREEDEGQIW